MNSRNVREPSPNIACLPTHRDLGSMPSSRHPPSFFSPFRRLIRSPRSFYCCKRMLITEPAAAYQLLSPTRIIHSSVTRERFYMPGAKPDAAPVLDRSHHAPDLFSLEQEQVNQLVIGQTYHLSQQGDHCKPLSEHFQFAEVVRFDHRPPTLARARAEEPRLHRDGVPPAVSSRDQVRADVIDASDLESLADQGVGDKPLAEVTDPLRCSRISLNNPTSPSFNSTGIISPRRGRGRGRSPRRRPSPPPRPTAPVT